jgi:SAM-dependent methyltransferase
MDLTDLRKNWQALGKKDPLWAILTHEEKKGRRWNVAEFFATGQREIAEVLAYLDELGMLNGRRRALDFGCGVGRLAQALAGHFERVDGVDIADSMIRQARRFNRCGERVVYHQNSAGDLRIFSDETFDLVYSNIVLQHMRPVYALAYIREFIRVAVKTGTVLFQVPASTSYVPSQPEVAEWNDCRRTRFSALKRLAPLSVKQLYWRWRNRQPARIAMYTIPTDEVVSAVEAGGGRIVEIVEDGSAGPLYRSCRYCAVRV